jgi:hypothetical protein
VIERLGLRILIGAAAALAVASAGAATPATTAKQVRQTLGFVESLAADGSLVAYDGQGGQPAAECNRVYGWNVASHRGGRVSGRGTCDADSSSTGSGVAQLAVAGSRIAWITNIGGNTESFDRLFTSSFPPRGERRVAAVTRTGNVDCVLTGRTLGGLVGSGGILAYNIWTTAAANPDDEESCETKVTSGALRRIGSRGTSLLRTGTDTLVAQDADAGRIAVLHADGTLQVFSSLGKPLETIGIDAAKEIALTGDRLAVLTKSRRIQLYSVKTGRPGASFPVPRVSGELAAADGIVAYASGRTLHVIRLATGKDRAVATAPKTIVAVAASSRVLAYAYNVFQRLRNPSRTRDVGYVAVMPTASVSG